MAGGPGSSRRAQRASSGLDRRHPCSLTSRRGRGPERRALGDTSLFIALESGRQIRRTLPDAIGISVITVGELRLGVLSALDGPSRAQRLETLSKAESLEPLPIDAAVANAWAALRLALRDRGRRMPLNDSWIAATAIANRIPVVSQDADYDEAPGLEVIRV